jgi:hypothetical protein
MHEVEGLLAVDGDHKEHRNMLISTIAAWAIDHPGQSPRHEEIFPGHARQLQTAAFEKLRRPFATLLTGMVTLLREEGRGLERQPKREAEETCARLEEKGYEHASILDAASALLRERYGDMVS